MSDYSVQIDWSGKDSLPDSSADKIISGADFQTEFDEIETKMATKANVNGDATEAFSVASLTLGGTAITSTAAELNILDGVTATATEINLLDGITSVNDEDDMTSDSATSLATQQSIKAYVDAQVASATMTWTYITRTTLASTSTLTDNTYSTISISTDDVPATASAIILTLKSDGYGSSTMDMYVKSSLVAERIFGHTIAGNDSVETSGDINTITIPYTSSIDVKYDGDGSVTGYFYLDGYIS